MLNLIAKKNCHLTCGSIAAFFYRFKKKFWFFFFSKNSKLNTNPKKFKIKYKPRKFKIKHNILTIQTHPKNSKSNTNLENSKLNTTYSQYKYTQKIQNQTQRTDNINTVLQNIRTQTHESPPIKQNQLKSNTKSIQGTKKHKFRNTKEHKLI